MDAMQIVAEETNTHAETVVKRFLDISDAIVIGVAQKPEIRNVRIPNISASREDACADAIERGVELLGENGRAIGFAVAIGIFDELNALTVVGVTVEALAEMALHFGEAIIDRAGSQFLVEPIHDLPDIVHSRAEP